MTDTSNTEPEEGMDLIDNDPAASDTTAVVNDDTTPTLPAEVTD